MGWTFQIKQAPQDNRIREERYFRHKEEVEKILAYVKKGDRKKKARIRFNEEY